jgi:hypothetical protein
MQNLYGTTETGESRLFFFFSRPNCNVLHYPAQCMISELGSNENYLRPIPELGLQLVPALHSGDSQTQLCDLFLPLTALNCPHKSVRNRADGHITGDLFEEVKPGFYAFREYSLLYGAKLISFRVLT